MAKNMDEFQHSGMADASSAVAIGDDKFLVVTDEKNMFMLYNAFESGEPLATYDFSLFLDIEEDGKEADVEGSATLGGVTYWIGSHSRDKDGALARNRHQLFATSIETKKTYPKVRQVGQSYTNLVFDLLQHPSYRDLMLEDLSLDVREELSPKKPGALSIEGLTNWGDALLIGFRNPVPDDIALLAPVMNPLQMVLYGDRAVIGDPIRLDLGGRGVRSIDYLESVGHYLICAGSSGKERDAQYCLWNGEPESQPRKFRSMPEVDFNTEAVVTYPGRNGFQLLSDDGDNFKGKKTPKKEQFFRSLWIELPLEQELVAAEEREVAAIK